MTPDEYCQQKAGSSGSSFYYSFLFLEPARRRAITALYAFCREVDDAVDDATQPEIARIKLAWWRDELGRLFRGAPSHPVSRALQPAVNAHGLAERHFLEVIAGMEMDLAQQRYARFDELKTYCARVASAVGLLSAAIFGYSDARTLHFAHDLGMAFQLTNIIRDVGEDARRGRIYLPQEDLERFGVAAADILNARDSAAFGALMAFEAQRAREYYDAALAALPEADRWPQLPSLVMLTIYRTLLDEIAHDGFQVLRHKIAIPPMRKLWLAWNTRRRERRRHKQHLRRRGASAG